MAFHSFYLARFVNTDRPVLKHIVVTTIPINSLGQDDAVQLEASFRVDSQDDYECAKTGRLWESLLDEHPDVAFLILRVADMRYVLGSKYTSLTLYEKLQQQLMDDSFGSWLAQFRKKNHAELMQNMKVFLTNGQYAPSQRWRPATCHASFPHCKLEPSHTALLLSRWSKLGTDPQTTLFKYLNYHAIETNVLEGTMQFDVSTTTVLVRLGFYNQAATIENSNITGGAVRDRTDALSILRDTRETLELVFTMSKSSRITLTVEKICEMHKTLMKSSQLLRIKGMGEDRLSYVNIGITRQHTFTNVVAGSSENAKLVQFCPCLDVDAQLTTFCERINELLQVPDMDPFAAAAWISHVFVTIHPFEDGNGRLSRMLASLPLLKRGLPPLCIPASNRVAYFRHLNYVRANFDGDYQHFMDMLYGATLNSVNTLTMQLIDDEEGENH